MTVPRIVVNETLEIKRIAVTAEAESITVVIAEAAAGVSSVNGQTDVVVLNADNITEGVDNLYYTDARADVRVAAGIAAIALPNQNLNTDSEVQFSAVNLDSDRARINTNQTTTTSTTTTTVFTFGTGSFRTMKAIVSIASGIDGQAIEVLITHDGTTAYMTQYGELTTNYDTSLATLTVDISGGSVRLRGTSASATSTTYTILAQMIA